jgi:hypothetical protein
MMIAQIFSFGLSTFYQPELEMDKGTAPSLHPPAAPRVPLSKASAAHPGGPEHPINAVVLNLH